MKSRWMWVSLSAVVLILLLGAGLALARGALPSPAEAPAAAPVADAFTYQGELIRGTAPVSETCAMAFRLYDAADGGLQVGEPITTSVAVIDGLFTAALDFGASAFPGEARWLGIAVQCPGDPLFVAFPERQALTAAPYALYAKAAAWADAAPWDGLTGVPAGFADGVDDVEDADADAGNELNQAMALVGSTLVLTDTGAVSADLSGLAVRQLAAEFVMHAGESVAAGDVVTWMDGEAYGPAPRWGNESVYSAGNVGMMAMAALSPTELVVVYQDGANNSYGTAILGTVSGGAVTWGTPSVFNAAGTADLNVVALSETVVVIAYRDLGNSSYGTAIAGTPTDSGFFWGGESVFNAAYTDFVGAAALSETEVVIGYRDGGSSNAGTAILGTISSGTLSWGSESAFSAGQVGTVTPAALSETDVLVAYRDLANFGRGTAVLGTVSGGSLVWGNQSVFSPTDSDTMDVAVLSPTQVVLTYRDYGHSGRGTAIAGTVDGGDVTWGSPTVVPGSQADWIRVAPLSATEVVVAYVGSGYAGTAAIGELAGEAILWTRPDVFNADTNGIVDVAALAGGEFAVAYRDTGNLDYGTARPSNRMQRWAIGTAQHAAAGGETVAVALEGIADAHAGLTPGRIYYWQEDGSLGPTPTLTQVGLALSESELLLDQLWTQ